MLLMRKKLYFWLLFLVIVCILGGVFFWFNTYQNKGNDLSLDNPDYIFDIKIPASFNQDQRDRLQLKITETRKAYNDNKEDNWTWVMIGNMYLYAEDYERALLAFTKASEMQPDDITAVLNLGKIYEDYLIDYQAAEKYYSKAITIFPNQTDLYDRLADLYWQKMNRLKDAEAIYLQGLEKVDDQAAILLNLLNFYEQTDQIAKQKMYAKKLLDLYPDNEVYKKEFGDLIK